MTNPNNPLPSDPLPSDPSPTDLELLEPQARRELLVAYLDGELAAEPALAVSRWLDDNPGALREVEHLRHVWDLLEHYEDEPIPEGFAERVFDAVGIEHSIRRSGEREGKVLRLAWYRRPLATAAAVLVAVGATVFIMRAPSATEGTSPAATTDVVSVLEEVPEDQLGELLLNADALLSVDAAALDADFEDEVLSGEVLGG